MESLKERFGRAVLAELGAGEDAEVYLRRESVHEALAWLKREQGFNALIDMTALDLLKFPGKEPAGVCGRFELSWRLLRLDAAEGLARGRVAVKCRVAEGEPGPASAMDLWPVADWLEREVWDMFGVRPEDRPEIKRLLMYEEFVGHPLRKDYVIDKRQPLIAPRREERAGRAPEGDLRPRLVERPG